LLTANARLAHFELAFLSQFTLTLSYVNFRAFFGAILFESHFGLKGIEFSAFSSSSLQ
jgi:hypothetical protein